MKNLDDSEGSVVLLAPLETLLLDGVLEPDQTHGFKHFFSDAYSIEYNKKHLRKIKETPEYRELKQSIQNAVDCINNLKIKGRLKKNGPELPHVVGYATYKQQKALKLKGYGPTEFIGSTGIVAFSQIAIGKWLDPIDGLTPYRRSSAGGIIFYLYGSGNTNGGLLVAPKNSWTLKSGYNFQWIVSDLHPLNSIVIATGTEIGTGAANTKNINKALVDGGDAGWSAAYEATTKDPHFWYLPSKDEMRELWRPDVYAKLTNIKLNNQFTKFSATNTEDTQHFNYYWTSSQSNIHDQVGEGYSSEYAWAAHVGNNDWVGNGMGDNVNPKIFTKDSRNQVRAIRSFDGSQV